MLCTKSFLSLIFNIWFLEYTNLKYHILAYNLDINNAKVFSDPTGQDHRRGSYFGFSVALYANSKDAVLLVGSPRSNTSALPGIIEPGTVYKCSINDTCKEWVIDNSRIGWNKLFSGIQIRDNAWVGATIAVENKTNPAVVVCGPRWKRNFIARNRSNWFMNGICYWTQAETTRSFDIEAQRRILPLMNISEQIFSLNGIGVYHFGMSETGFSLHMISNESQWDLVLGSPGVHNWKGIPILASKSPNDNIEVIVPSIEEETRVRSGDYFGYAVTSGCYFTEGSRLFASGAPKAANMNGNVIVFSFSRYFKKRFYIANIIYGEQHGEYFGAALASCDLNNDGKDELIVGAPQWSKDMDEGRIYVFTGHNEKFQKQSFEGEVSGSRFGSVVTCLGDIDYDGHGDIAVGAPYEDESGAIYIFNGNSNGLPKRYSQKIIGSYFHQGIRGFGISISEPRDINGDNYPDIAVGAYLSEHAILLKSKPVVTVITKLLYRENKELLTNSTVITIDTCTSFAGIYAPESLGFVRILKADPMYRRAAFNMGKNNIYKLHGILQKSKVVCDQVEVNLKENIQNIIDPLEISVTVNLEEEPKSQPNLFCSSCAIMNKLLSKVEDLMKLPFAVECGEDKICTSDVEMELSTNLKSDNEYIIGSTSTVDFIINVYNYGEPAYQAKLYAYIPEILSLASIPLECLEASHKNNTLEVICDVGNPLKKNKTIILQLDTSEVRYNVDRVQLWTNFTTQSEDKNTLDNVQNLTVYFGVDVDIAIAGKAQEDLYSYFQKNMEHQSDSIRFQHIYEVQKFGTSPIEEAVLTIDVPTYWKRSTDDIEIVNINQTIGYIDGKQFHCATLDMGTTSLTDITNSYSTHSEVESTHEKFTIEENPLITLPPDNRSLYINCTNAAIKCVRLQCKLGPFLSSLSVAKLSLTLDLRILNFQLDAMNEKDIIFFVTNGNVEIIQPDNVTQISGHKPDNAIVATTFLGSPIVQQIATWIIAVSVILGIILLVLLILALVKVGFFNRKKKEELEALKAETDRTNEITLETTSSREVLNEE